MSALEIAKQKICEKKEKEEKERLECEAKAEADKRLIKSVRETLEPILKEFENVGWSLYSHNNGSYSLKKGDYYNILINIYWQQYEYPCDEIHDTYTALTIGWELHRGKPKGYYGKGSCQACNIKDFSKYFGEWIADYL